MIRATEMNFAACLGGEFLLHIGRRQRCVGLLFQLSVVLHQLLLALLQLQTLQIAASKVVVAEHSETKQEQS